MPKTSDGFDYPMGQRDSDGRITATQERYDSDGYYVAADFESTIHNGKPHLGEDWNGDIGADKDSGDPIYAVSDGTVRFAGDAGNGWGNVVIIDHVLPSREYGGTVASAYEHLDSINVAQGADVERGVTVIGGLGKTGGQEHAHLHFEIRSDESLGAKVPSYSATTDGWIDPSDFIDAHRELGLGSDTLIGNGSDDNLNGGDGNDKLFGNWGNDKLFGNGGDDILSGGWGFDLLDGGKGTDTADYSFYTDSDGLNVNLGSGKVSFRPEHSYGSPPAFETVVGIENVDGGGGDDVLTGNAGVNVLRGAGGDDTLAGGEGGKDILEGGPGADVFNVIDPQDVVLDFNISEGDTYYP